MASGMNAIEPFVKCYSGLPMEYCFSRGGAREGTGTWRWVWSGIALLVAQADGQIEPGVSSTKDYGAAPKGSVRPQI